MEPLLLISLDWLRPGDPRTGLGISSIAAAVRAAGFPVHVIADAVNRPDFDCDAFVSAVQHEVETLKPAWIGVGAFVWNEPEVQALRVALAGRRVVLGGPQVSFAEQGSLEALYPGVCAFIRGHGEAAMVRLMEGLAVNGQDGLHVAGMNDRGHRADIPLTHLASPHLDGTLPPGSFVRWETQRGCPFKCSFCQHREAGARLTRREFGDTRIDAELCAFASAQTQRIAVLDPIFHANRARATRLLRRAQEVGLRAHLSLQCRFELLTDDFVEAAAALDTTLEFGLQTIHDAEGRAVDRRQNMERVARWVDELHHRGIAFEVSLIYGLPEQTLESFVRSVEWCLGRGIARVRAWPLMLLRGTPLHAQRERWGLVESTGDRIPIVVESDTFSRRDQQEMAAIAAWLDDNPGARTLWRSAA